MLLKVRKRGARRRDDEGRSYDGEERRKTKTIQHEKRSDDDLQTAFNIVASLLGLRPRFARSQQLEK